MREANPIAYNQATSNLTLIRWDRSGRFLNPRKVGRVGVEPTTRGLREQTGHFSEGFVVATVPSFFAYETAA